MKPFEYSVFVGRFQPFHLAHYNILQEGLNHSEKVVVVVGSHNKARDTKNPWLTEERLAMIKASLSPEDVARIIFVPLKDYLYNDNLWVSHTQNMINEVTGYSENIALIGYESDKSSYYLKLFPQWKFLSCSTHYPFHATRIRDMYFNDNPHYKNCVPEKTAQYLEEFKKTPQYETLCEEKKFLDNYKQLWEDSPFPPTFTTTDTVVIKSGHVLLVRRKGNPGRGLIALPGGFIKEDEAIVDSAIRELKEETGIKITREELKKSITDQRVFDHPYRSLRGRTITHAYCLDLGYGPLPAVKGESDADKAWWMPISEVYGREEEFFEDHWHIIHYFCSKF